MEPNIIKTIESLGISNKAAKVYLANLALGEATVLALSKKSKVSRTSIYYTLEELKKRGMITEVERGKKKYIMYVEPEVVIRDTRQKFITLNDVLPQLEEIKFSEKRKPRIEFYFAPAGFKEIWFKVLHSGCKDFNIITDAPHFLGYVKEQYIVDEIIAEKRKKDIRSKQIIVDSRAARLIATKDNTENRETKFLTPDSAIRYTEIITDTLVAFISPRFDNVMFTIDQKEFAATRRSLFETLWKKL